MIDEESSSLVDLAKQARRLIVKISAETKSSHVGSNLSVIDLIIASLGWIKSRHDENDRFHLSKGHSALAFYAAKHVLGDLSLPALSNYGKQGSPLAAHLNSSDKLGVELSTGSLGHALPFAVGKQIGSRAKFEQNFDIVCLSDGELNEGSVWEAVQLAGHLKLGNLVALVDKNNIQSLASTQETLNLDPLGPKFEVFGWRSVEIAGHNLEQLSGILRDNEAGFDKPLAVICNTVKGKGVSFMENQVSWHYKSPNDEELSLALKELQ